jgi:CheY-like chemotaxis protein
MSKILVIDDDPSNRDILRTRLEVAGHDVAEASDGEQGLLYLENQSADLIVLDVMMPRVDGLQVCAKIKANPKTKGIPVILLTALGQQIDQLRGWESGADDYLTKPWDSNKLMQLVQKWCPASKSPEGNVG